jgi:hypothetical protein
MEFSKYCGIDKGKKCLAYEHFLLMKKCLECMREQEFKEIHFVV